jgi:tRNA A-37 threonylcarbamoyl transferase component Bud32
MDESLSNQTRDFADDSLAIQADEFVDTIFDQNYLILKCIGRGAFGAVYKAKDLAFDRTVAIKLFNPRTVDVPRLKVEAQTLVSLDHPNIVRIYRMGVCPRGRPYLACEYIDGINLWGYINNNQCDLETILAILDQIAAALQYVHSHGMIHRDIKPGNVVVCISDNGSPIAKLIDFGCAKNLDLAHATTQKITKTGQFLGTAAYASPEQIKNEVIDHRTDIYSFGILLAEACTVEGLLTPGLKRIVERATNQRMENRYNSMEEIREQLISSKNIPVGKAKMTAGLPLRLLVAILSAALIPIVVFWSVSKFDRDTKQARLDRMRILVERLKKNPQVSDPELGTMSKEMLALLGQLPGNQQAGIALINFVDAAGVQRVPELAPLWARASALCYELRMKKDFSYFAYKVRELECLKKVPTRWNEAEKRVSTDLAELEREYEPRLLDPPKEALRRCYVTVIANIQQLEGNHVGALNTLKSEWVNNKDPESKSQLAYHLAEMLASAGDYEDAMPFAKEAVSYYSHYNKYETASAQRIYEIISHKLSKKQQ